MAEDFNDLFAFYTEAYDFVTSKAPEAETYRKEVSWQRHVSFEKVDDEEFFREYMWVVISSGMRNQVARIIEKRAYETMPTFSGIGHPAKRAAILKMHREFPEIFRKLKALRTDDEKVAFIGTLPFMGPIIRWHLAKNLGLDCAKPDRHLVRLANRFGYGDDVQKMCADLGRATGDRVSVVDLVLWRNANLKGSL